MGSFNWSFFLLAVLGTSGLIGIGIGIAEGSPLIIIGAIVLTIVSVGTGFTLKKKKREQGEGV
ncbi:DUF5325 family protein [Evansella tamaricis]|uniref:YlaF family protein n=1 Tax=Evansella tamaricis TaxID=2069301 RepID=A0ABS6JC59_9BACI|nr:DUF5325 family protein [Evansella tamaricis]MBU9711267.1 YlaF family protein [Evansella tamaricis]